MSFEDIRNRFQVPARKGARVLAHGQPGTVTTVRGLTLRVRLDGMRWSQPYMPDELQWLPADAPEAPQVDAEAEPHD